MWGFNCSLPFKGIFKKKLPLRFQIEENNQGNLFSSFEVWRLLYPFYKPDPNSVCCSLLNYVSLKHKCVGFRKLQISVFPYSLGEYNFNHFVLGRKNIACIITQGSSQCTPSASFFGSKILRVLQENDLELLTIFHVMFDFLFYKNRLFNWIVFLKTFDFNIVSSYSIRGYFDLIYFFAICLLDSTKL